VKKIRAKTMIKGVLQKFDFNFNNLLVYQVLTFLLGCALLNPTYMLHAVTTIRMHSHAGAVDSFVTSFRQKAGIQNGFKRIVNLDAGSSPA
jgi:hypothetical protein